MNRQIHEIYLALGLKLSLTYLCGSFAKFHFVPTVPPGHSVSVFVFKGVCTARDHQADFTLVPSTQISCLTLPVMVFTF